LERIIEDFPDGFGLDVSQLASAWLGSYPQQFRVRVDVAEDSDAARNAMMARRF
jgi:hypothetical protein